MTNPVVKPTPTQAECDASARGEHILEHEWDGSPYQDTHMSAAEAIKQVETPLPIPQGSNPPEPAMEEKAAEADKDKATYRTRRAKAEEEK